MGIAPTPSSSPSGRGRIFLFPLTPNPSPLRERVVRIGPGEGILYHFTTLK